MNKTCNKCGASVPAEQKFCTSCGGNEFTEAAAVQPTVAPVQPAVAPVTPVAPVAGAQPPKKGMPTWLKVILIILLVLVLLVGGCTAGCVILTKSAVDSANDIIEDIESDLDYDYDYDYDYDEEDDEEDTSSTDTYGLGDTFTFDDIEYSLGTTISYGVVENMFSDVDGRDAIKIPVTVKNVGDESTSVSTLWMKLYGPSGNELANVEYYFDDSIAYAGSLLPGATKDTYIYLLYESDGTYTMEFDDWTDKLTVKFDVTK